jgi:hypothetical protein
MKGTEISPRLSRGPWGIMHMFHVFITMLIVSALKNGYI